MLRSLRALTRRDPRVPLLLVVAAVTWAVLVPEAARADCALIPAAIQILPSQNGAVSQPFAAPGDTVSVFSDAACKPSGSFPHFAPAAASNEITLTFLPPTGAAPPPVSFAASSVADCGNNRCFALQFVMPDLGFTGPARLEVQNLAAAAGGNPGAPEAVIEALFDPTIGCNAENRAPNLFGTFTVLPSRNAYSADPSATLVATVDGSGALLIPFDYSAELAEVAGLNGPVRVGGTGSVRLLRVTADVPNGLAGGNGLPVDSDLLRIPRLGSFVRAFSLTGRPIPPLLEVTASNPVLGATGYGDTVVGSVDFIDSVIRIARSGIDPASMAPVTLFALDHESAAPGPAFANGAIQLTGVTLEAGAAAPLNSLNSTAEVAVIARDEKLEVQFGNGNQNDTDTDSDDKVVAFVNLATGETINTGRPVLEANGKAVMKAAGPRVAFLSSEAHDNRMDGNGDEESIDGLLRVWTTETSRCGGAPACDLSAVLLDVDPLGAVPVEPSALFENAGAPSSLVFSGPPGDPHRFVFLPRREWAQGRPETFLAALTEAETNPTGDATQPFASSDGRQVAFTATDAALVGLTEVTIETGSFVASVDNTTFPAETLGAFAFDPGDADVAGFDLSSLTPDCPSGPSCNASFLLGSQTSACFPPEFDLWGVWSVVEGADSWSGTVWDPGIDPCPNIGRGQASSPNLENGTLITTQAGWDEFESTGSIPSLGDFGLVNPRGDTMSVVSNSIGPGATFDLTGTFVFQADAPATASGSQVFVRDWSSGVVTLLSRNESGIPADCASHTASLDLDGGRAAFLSCASNLSSGGPAMPADQVYFVEPATGTVALVSRTPGGQRSNGAAFSPLVSGDGGTVVYVSQATDVVPAAGAGFEVYAYDVASQTNQRISTDAGGQPSGSALRPGLGVSADGNVVAFASTANDLVAGTADTNAASDVFVHDRSLGTTQRVSVGFAGAEANGASSSPHLSADGNLVIFVSAATNLLPPGSADVGSAPQCYLYDRTRGTTRLVSATLGGDAADGACQSPFVAPGGRFATFAATAGNIDPGFAGVRAVYFVDLLTGVTAAVAPSPIGTLGSVRTGVSDLDVGIVVFDTTHPLSLDVTLGGPADLDADADAYGVRLVDIPDFDGDLEYDDDVVFVFDANGVDPSALQNTGLAFDATQPAQVAVAGGRAAVVPKDGGQGHLWNAAAGPGSRLVPMMTAAGAPLSPQQVALTESVYCAIADGGGLHVGDPSTGVSDPATGVVAQQVKAIGDRCVFRDAAGQLGIAQLGNSPPIVTTGLGAAADFQLGEDGVAFRTCEGSGTPDLNLDADIRDCVMRFRWFVPPAGAANPVETRHTAVPCTFPGCDPFFEPYRVGPGIVSFVTDELKERNEAGSSAKVGVTCLPTSPLPACDKTGNGLGTDVAVEIFNLRSGKAQVFPVKRNNPPQVNPFPVVMTGDKDNVLAIQLPAEIAGEAFSDLAPATPVTLILGSPDGDGVFEADGNLDRRTAVVDSCREVANDEQRDADGDALGAACDFTRSGSQPNDDPGGSPEPAKIPGDDPSKLCNLNSLQNASDVTITRPEVDQIFADIGLPITQPIDSDGDGVVDRTSDLRDRDADGLLTAVDWRLCMSDCEAQTLAGGAGFDGCPDAEPTVNPNPGNGGLRRCGLVGAELMLALAPLWMRRRRMLERWRMRS